MVGYLDAKFGAAVDAASTKNVTDQSAMLALPSPSIGDQVYRQDNQKLMMYNGSGWYVMATINTAPTINSVSQTTAASTTTLSAGGSFALNNSNNNTVITINATDPDEGTTLSYSYAVTNSTSLGSAATVTQGTGADVNKFTINPSSDTAGTFQLTFSATDGTSTATFVQNFALTFSAPMSGGTETTYGSYHVFSLSLIHI